MNSRAIHVALAGALVGLACGPSELIEPAAQPAASQEDAIIGGTLAMGDPAVVAMAVRYGGGYESVCTGTLIAPKTVLTAAHCINAYGTNVQYFVTFGTYSASPTRAVLVAQQYKNPNYNQSAWDFGILRLATPVLDVTPIAINETAITQAHIGRAIRHVGFGLTVAGGQTSGTKREVSYGLRRVTPYTIESGAQGKQTCQGDSGGPGFMVMPGGTQEVLVGVVSYGDQNCMYEGYDGRVDVAAPWIRQTMASWEQPTCATDGACLAGCTPVDQDCVCKADGVCGSECTDPAMDPDCPRDCAQNSICSVQACGRPDADCAGTGQFCAAAVQCQSRLCVNDRQNPSTYCSKSCQTNAECPATMQCAAGSCVLKQRPERALFDSCYAATDYCLEGICTGPAGGISRCVKSCLVTNDCPSGSVCEAGSDSQRFCRPANVRFNIVNLPAAPAALGAQSQGCSATGMGMALWLLAVPLLRRRRARR
ncbi:MAG: trypsin-like serine protease [Archangium sp.]|nr:trypsin-like serine protease [Archangium sp.]MDP3569186.1 trypsin-like serine protease [Archangium sp.]